MAARTCNYRNEYVQDERRDGGTDRIGKGTATQLRAEVSRDEVQAQGASLHGNRAAGCELTRHAKLSNELNSAHRLGTAPHTDDNAIPLQKALAFKEQWSLYIPTLNIRAFCKGILSTGNSDSQNTR
jgi:hypothetical protein